MRNTPFDTRSSEWAGDMAVWLRENAEDNSQRLERLYRNLRQVREQELTPRQQQVLELYYDRHLTLREIAQELGFLDVYHFSKSFKKQVGVSPRAYLQREEKK